MRMKLVQLNLSPESRFRFVISLLPVMRKHQQRTCFPADPPPTDSPALQRREGNRLVLYRLSDVRYLLGLKVPFTMFHRESPS